MKIVCSSCKKVIGEQKPYKDPSEIKATCTACIEKTKEEAARFVPEPEPSDGQEITLENGLKGILWSVKGEKDKLYFGDLAVRGRKFCCLKNGREKFQAYLASLPGEETDVSFLHSMTCILEPSPRGRKKKEVPPNAEKPKRHDSVQWNCTVKVPKQYVQPMYDDMAEHMEKVYKILAEMAVKAYRKKHPEAAREGDPASMSASIGADISNPK